MGKKIVKTVLWICAILLGIFLILFAVLYANRDKFSGVLVKEINKHLAVPVDVSDVQVSLRKFPNASFVFTDVFSEGAYSQAGDTLVYAERIYLQFSIWQVLFQSVSIRKIDVENAVVNLRLRNNGRDNYRIWKTDTTSSADGLFTLESVNLNDVKSRVLHESSGFGTNFFMNELSFKGNFEPSNYRLENKGEFEVHELWVGENRYLNRMPFRTSFTLAGYADSILINPVRLQWEDLLMEGRVAVVEGETRAQVSANSLDLESLQELLHTQGWYTLKGADISGQGAASFKGVFGDNEKADFRVDFTASDASLNGYRDARIRDIACEGHYLSKNGKDYLELKRFNGKGETGNLEGDAFIRDLDRPFVNLNLKSDLELAEWLVLFPLDTIENAKGKVLVDLHFENQFGSFKSVKASELQKATTRGSLHIEEAGFQFMNSSKRVENLNGELAFKGNDLEVKRLYFKTGESDIYLDGRFGNVLNFILLEGQKLRVDCSVQSQEIDLSDFVGSSKKGSDSYNLDFTRSLDLDLLIGVDRFEFQKFQASGITANLSIHDGQINVSQMALKADGGDYTGTFTIDVNNPELYGVKASLNASNINIHELFVSFEDFGQEAIAADNIYGRGTSSIDFKARMKPDLTVLTETVEMTARIRIKDGNLKNYEPMKALSRFADIKELEDVRFSSLDNTISISNSQVLIPRMNVESNVLSLQISGVHDFSNQINYTMRLKLDDVLFSKKARKQKKSEFDEHLVEVEYNDDPYIYIKMSGKASDPEISLDRESLGESISEDLKEQGKELREIFKKEEPKKKEDPGIIFEWEEEDNKRDQN